MSKHTPGPWVLQSYRLYASQMAKPEYPIHAPKRGLIAKAFRETDARLIAAAPDLLETLILMVRTHDEPAESLLQEVKEQQWIQKARAAIAKATGERL